MIVTITRHARNFCSAANPSNIMKYLCVAEKNDAAKTISSILSGGAAHRREGYSKFNKIYEFDSQVFGQNATLVFTSVSGHLLSYDFSNAYRAWKSCSPEQLFDAPIVKSCPQNFEKIKQTLEKEIRTCKGLIIWTDCDREGENIGYEIINVCRAVKANITVNRAKFSDMTGASLRRAMNTLGPPDELVSKAVDVRQELDLRIGAAFTRYQTLRLQNIFPNNIDDTPVSYGSCQFPTLGFVVQRYKEIEEFVPQDFWKIKMTHKIDKLTVEFHWARNRLFDRACCESLLMLCKADPQAKIIDIQQKSKNKWRPVAMDTVELEKTGSRKLKLTAKTIMTIAEKLYTQGLISYPRTETNKFSKETNLRSLVEMQKDHNDWGEFAQRVLQWGPNPRNGNKSDQAHPPIHPTKFTNSLQGDEKRVYELIVRTFLACVSKDAVGFETIATAELGKEEFTATGLVILERNYLDVYPYEKWTGKEIHNYEVGQRFTPTELGIQEGKTSAPQLLTEADLIGLMDKHGIGTDATHAELISKIKERNYIGEVNSKLVPGQLGMGLYEGYELMQSEFTKPKLRAAFEEDLKAICDGRKDAQAVLREQIEIYRTSYRVVIEKAIALDRALAARFQSEPLPATENFDIPSIVEIFKCPKCRTNSMTVKQKRDNTGAFITCLGFPGCKHAIFINELKELAAVDEVCQNCRQNNKKIKIKFKQIATLGMMIENANFSRIEGTHFISCLVCDSNMRQVLNIPADSVKILGNIVSASANPIHHNDFARPQNRDGRGGSPPARNFSSRPNWYHDNDDDDDRPMGGGGAIAVSNNTGNSWNSSRPNQSSSSGNANNRSAGPSSSSSNARANDTSKLPSVNCKCGVLAAKFTVKADTPNKGRPFYTCMSKKCKFFVWADQPLPADVQVVASGAAGGKRKCSSCRQEGHTKRNCPSLPSFD